MYTHRMKNARDIRYENFLSLFEAFKNRPGIPEHGALRRFADHIGISQRQVSFLKGRHRNIGSNTARQIERAFNLPSGWMDNPQALDSPRDRREPAPPEEQLLQKAIMSTMSLYQRNPDAARALCSLADQIGEAPRTSR